MNWVKIIVRLLRSYPLSLAVWGSPDKVCGRNPDIVSTQFAQIEVLRSEFSITYWIGEYCRFFNSPVLVAWVLYHSPLMRRNAVNPSKAHTPRALSVDSETVLSESRHVHCNAHHSKTPCAWLCSWIHRARWILDLLLISYHVVFQPYLNRLSYRGRCVRLTLTDE